MRFLLVLPLLLLAACGASDARYLIDNAPAPEPRRLVVGSIELRDVSLPAYAEASEILVESPDGALREIDGAIWADTPQRAMTLALADHMARAGNARVAAEPWPLETPADVRAEVRITRMVARADGTFALTGSYALTSYESVIRDRIERFEITIPLAGTAPGDIAAATGEAIRKLSEDILSRLAR
ncbi:PqiC family protein [Aestuariicoccus sp. MJ-SS9]|uniref:PqiC family protein n=1 Tax=Aestuariicoccus sp. MJ-SS9 TaxID=3079855 RepID=UPI002911FCB1|nr:PqiC family protein [Aestuariicoccus sp. MJ-SS9]MDU8913326.1 PqiC family protein [Aestuariicoccus sp. MJ-SS9]